MVKYENIIKKGLFSAILLVLIFFGIKYFSLPTHIGKQQNTNGFTNEGDFDVSSLDEAAYGNLPKNEIERIANDFAVMSRQGLYYQPWVQFSEPLFKSKSVNVITDETGMPMRFTPYDTDSNNYPLYKIFLFGSSTTFGYNVADWQTIPVYLTKMLTKEAKERHLKMRIEVVNYGRPYYEPSADMQLLLDLLKLGHRPSLSIFLNGINLGKNMDVPVCTDEVVNRFYKIQFGESDNNINSKQIISALLAHLGIHKEIESPPVQRINLQGENDTMNLALFVNRITQDKEITKSISALYGVKSIFFSQPNSHYNYPIQLFRDTTMIEPESRKKWDIFYKMLLPKNPDIISMHNLFEQYGRKGIVDYAHYSPGFNEFIAQNMVQYINLDSLINYPYKLDSAAATGTRRNVAEKILEVTGQGNATQNPSNR
jgi:hypothetical protein